MLSCLHSSQEYTKKSNMQITQPTFDSPVSLHSAYSIIGLFQVLKQKQHGPAFDSLVSLHSAYNIIGIFQVLKQKQHGPDHSCTGACKAVHQGLHPPC